MTDTAEATATMAEARARLAAPLPYPSPPVILTPAMRCEWDELTDAQRAGRATDQGLLDEWHAQAWQATFGPLDDWLHHAPLPAMMP